MDKAQKHWERIQQKKKREAEQISAAIVKEMHGLWMRQNV